MFERIRYVPVREGARTFTVMFEGNEIGEVEEIVPYPDSLWRYRARTGQSGDRMSRHIATIALLDSVLYRIGEDPEAKPIVNADRTTEAPIVASNPK